MTSRLRVFLCFVLLAASREAQAGMPGVQLSDLAEIRLDAISFFLMVLLVSSLAVKLIWNSLLGDFPKLPRLSYLRAVSLVVLWGMFSVIVLTMISGARELMTPGAWQRDGFTHRLSEPASQQVAHDFIAASDDARRRKLSELWRELMRTAAENEGRFPSKRDSVAIDHEYWRAIGGAKLRFVYLEGRSIESDDLLVYEPECYADGQLGLMTSGEIRYVHKPEILKARGVDTSDAGNASNE